MAMKAGTCKRTRGGGCLCKSKSGKVKFAKRSRCKR